MNFEEFKIKLTSFNLGEELSEDEIIEIENLVTNDKRSMDFFMAQEKVFAALNSDDIRIKKLAGYSYYKVGRIDDAIRLYEEVVDSDPDNEEAKSMLATLLKEKGVPLEEIPKEYIETLVRALVATAEKNLNGEQDFEKIAGLYQEAFLWNPEDHDIQKTFGIMLHRAGRNSEAIKVLEDVKRFLDNDPFVFINIGHSCVDLGDYQKALVNFEKAYEIDPLPRNLSLIGVSHAFLEELDKAKEIVEKAYALDPGDYSVWNDKSIIHLRSGEYEEAISLFEKCMEIVELTKIEWNMAVVYSNISMAYYNVGKVDHAKQYITAAAKLDPNNKIIKQNYETIFMGGDSASLMLI